MHKITLGFSDGKVQLLSGQTLPISILCYSKAPLKPMEYIKVIGASNMTFCITESKFLRDRTLMKGSDLPEVRSGEPTMQSSRYGYA
jgi:hypothetical protein